MHDDALAHGPEGERLEARREAMRLDLNRTTTAVAVILMVVLVLAVAAVFAGMRATRNLKRAELAESASRDRLWHSYLAQARAVRLTPDAGRRQTVLEVISNAVSIRISPGLRTEAVAALALPDLYVDGPVQPIPKGADQVEMDVALQRYAYGTATGDAFVCDLTNGEALQTLQSQDLGPGTQQPVRSVAFSPDGSRLAVRFSGGAMVIYDIASRKPLVTSALDATNLLVAGMSFWPDENKISFGDADAQGQITVYDFDTAQRIGTGVRVGARTFRFKPGTRQVAVATDNRVDLIEFPTEKVIQTLETPTRVFTITWLPAGDELAVATEDGDIYLWNLARSSQRVFRGHSEPCIRLTFSPDGELLASGSRDGTTRLWDVAQGQTIVLASDGLAHVFSNDGRRLGFWKPSVGFGTWRLSRSECYSLLVCPKSEGAFLSLDLSPSGRWCIATQTRGIRVWDLASESREWFIPLDDLQSVRIAPDESSLYVCRRHGLERWPFHANATGVEIETNAIAPVALPDNRGARAIAISLQGRSALVELTDLRLAVLDLTGSNAPVLLRESCRFASLRTPASPTGAGRFAISPDGRWVVTGFGVGEEDHPKVWDARTGEPVATLASGTSVVGFSPDGRLLGTAGTASFGIWSVGDWEPLNRFDRDEPTITHGSIAFMQGSTEVAVTRTRQQAQLRDALKEEKYADLVAPQLQSVNSIRMSLDGAVLVTASATDKLQVWHLKKIRQKLASIGLEWKAGTADAPLPANAQPVLMNPTQTALIVSLVGFGLVAGFGLIALRRHRSAVSGYLAAETKADERDRELEVAKVELMHSQKMRALGTLATGIAHDFNNLLSVIRMSNKLIGRETKGDPEIQEHVADIEQAVLQGKHVVGSMLGYSRNEPGASLPTDVSTVVEDVVSLLSKEFLSGIALTLELDRHAPAVGVGRGRLEQVLLNLVVNASEAMQGQGKLKISVHSRQALPPRSYVLRPGAAARFVELNVTDSGPGIPADIHGRLFEPFFTTKLTGAKAGTGLGLSLVYSIAQQDGLGLGVESEPGKGATFILILPILDS